MGNVVGHFQSISSAKRIELQKMESWEDSSIFTTYGEPHRRFVQCMLSRGIVTFTEFTTIFEAIFKIKRSNVPWRSRYGRIQRELIEKKLKTFVGTVNQRIEEKCNLKLLVGVDEESSKRRTFLVLANRMDRTKDTNKLTINDQFNYAPHEMEYLKRILNEIVKNPMRQIKSTRALNIAKNTENIETTQEAEDILQKLMDRKWLTENEMGIILLSTRFIIEMGPFIQDQYPDLIKNCDQCRKIVIRSVECPDEECDSQYHASCAMELNHKCFRCKSALPEMRQNNRSVECPDEEGDSQYHASCAMELNHECFRCKSALSEMRQNNRSVECPDEEGDSQYHASCAME